MMNKLKRKWLAALVLLLPAAALAVGFDEIKDFGEAYKISGHATSRSVIEVSWDIADGYYLYNNKFLRFKTNTPGVVFGAPDIPLGESQFDELLNTEVVKYHHQLSVRIPLESVPTKTRLVNLQVRAQGCLEKVLCYPPTVQELAVSLPPAPVVAAHVTAARTPMTTSAIAGLFNTANSGSLQAATGAPALPPEEAFSYQAIGLSNDTILVRFTAQPGYYLYRDKFAFRIADGSDFQISEVALPRGKVQTDPEFGPVEVYYGLIEIPVRVIRPAGPETTITLEADYQGCKDGDICYPPQTTDIQLLMPASATDIEATTGQAPQPASDELSVASNRPVANLPAAPVSQQDKLAQTLTRNPWGALLAFFVAGMLLAFTPCVFPMVPILSGIIAGQGEHMTTARAFWLSLVYVLAMAVTYTVAGVLAGLFGQNLQAVFQNPWILGFFIAIFVALALSMFGFFELQLPARLQTRLTQASNKQHGGSLVGVAIMGFLSALIVGPCVAPPLAAALIVIGASGSAVLGGAALFSLAMGMGVPLILFGVSAGKLVPRAGAWMNAVKAVFGIGLLALAVWMLERIVQGPVILLLWGVLAIASGVYLGALEGVAPGASGWRRLWKSLGLVLLLLGALELIGAMAGGDDWMKPLKGVRTAASDTATEHIAFRRIKSLADLEGAVAQANQAGKPAMLDFYADWCVECLRMDRNTFSEPGVQALFQQLQPLQADVTVNDDVDKQLLANFGIIGPPAILFFDRHGKELRDYRLVGYFGPQAFVAHLRKVLDLP